jgi:hypothetical protein
MAFSDSQGAALLTVAGEADVIASRFQLAGDSKSEAVDPAAPSSAAGFDQLQDLRAQASGPSFTVEGFENQFCGRGEVAMGGGVGGTTVEFPGLVKKGLTVRI